MVDVAEVFTRTLDVTEAHAFGPVMALKGPNGNTPTAKNHVLVLHQVGAKGSGGRRPRPWLTPGRGSPLFIKANCEPSAPTSIGQRLQPDLIGCWEIIRSINRPTVSSDGTSIMILANALS